jgi:hypothetical protein
MIKYISERQLTIEEFKTPFQNSLLPDNRWVKLSKIVPWDKFAKVYISMMSSKHGRPGLSPRLVLGALIIKHIENLDDRGVITNIQENIYMQFFVGLKEFKKDPVFDPSLFVEIRKRVGADVIDSLSKNLIKSFSDKSDSKHKAKAKTNDKAQVDTSNKSQSTSSTTDDKEVLPKNKGKLQLDATVADQYITYPTDNGILNASRKQSENLIDKLYELNDKKEIKPRTYRRTLDKSYLNYSKKKRKSNADNRKMTRKLLPSIKRNIRHINNMLDVYETTGMPFPLKHSEQRMLWIINTVYLQQKFMYETKTHSCDDRIVNIFQPHIRPIPRGKAKSKTEFGSKLGVSLDQGFARIDTFSWDAYNEGGDLIKQVEAYKNLHGFYPELVQVDKIYSTRKNRKWLKERGIRITAPPLGRRRTRSKETYYQKTKRKKEAAERNQIEGKFGQGKNAYNLNKIRAKLRSTSESWVATIFFIMNLIHYEKNIIFSWFYLQIRRLIKVNFCQIKRFISFICK